MSYFTEAFHKMIRKTPAPRIMFNSKDSSYVVVDSRTGMPRLQNQCIQPQVGMYSVLTMGDHLDVVVRYERTLPFTLPVSSDEDCPQVTYVMPRQNMKAGDFFTLFVGREHFMVQVVQILSKSSSGYGPEKNSDSSSFDDASIAPRSEPVQSSANLIRHSEPRSSSTRHRQDEETPTPLSQPIHKPVTKPLPARPDRLDRAVFCTRTRVDDEKIQNSTRANAPATSGNHLDHARYTFVDLEPAPHEVFIRPSGKIHQTNPSINHDVSHLDINITLQAASLPPLTNLPPSRRPESPQLSAHGKISDASKSTREKERVRKRSATERNFKNMLSSGTPLSNVPSTIRKVHETSRESPRSSHPLRELRNIGRGYEPGTIENSSESAATHSVDSCPSDATKPRSTVSLEPSQRSPLGFLESDIKEALGLGGDYVIYVAPSKRMWISQHDFDRLRLHERELLA